MYLEANINDCDFTGREYDSTVRGALVIAQGATGRFCPVMSCGPEYIKKHGIKPLSRDEIAEQCLDILKDQNTIIAKQKQYTDDELNQFIDF